jgi:glycosyltransferase involved in cell wall biosynthesis
MLKKILILAYHFPPEQSGGVSRPYSLFQHLPLYGYEPIVVTIKHEGAEPVSNVIRCQSLVRGVNSGVWNRHLVYRVANKVLKYVGGHPSTDLLWDKSVRDQVDGILEQHDIELVYATYPPVGTVKLGMKISRKFGIPLVTEFRDGLTFEPLSRYSALQHFLTARFERQLVSHSAAVITIGENISKFFANKYGKQEVYTVYNGYDTSPQPWGDRKETSDSVMRFVHFGSLNLSVARSVAPLFHGLALLKSACEGIGKAFSVTFIGNYTTDEIELARTLGLCDVVTFQSPVSKNEGLRDIAENYDCLVLYGVPNNSGFISGKLLEYINLKKPIVGICRGNEAANIIAQTRTGVVCDFHEREICDLFLQFINKEITFAPDLEKIASFDRKVQAGQVASVLNTLMSARASRRSAASSAPR